MRSISRQIFQITYWLSVAAAGYFFIYPNRSIIDGQLTELVGPFATPLFIVLGMAALFGLFYLNNAIIATMVSIHTGVTGGGPVNYETGNFAVKIARTAARLEKRGDFIGAAEAYETLEMWVEASGAYEKGGQLSRAAQSMDKAGYADRAIRLYESEENYEMAAERANAEGMRERAMENYRQAGHQAEQSNRFAQAADYYEKAQEYQKAGRVYESLKRTEDALRCYARANMPEKIEELIQQIDPMRLIARGEAGEELVRRAAEVLARNGNCRKAGELLEAAQDYVRAAEFYEKSKNFELAAECYLKAGLFDRGVASVAKVDDIVTKADFLARVAISQGEWGEAGKQFMEAGKLTQAVDAFKRAKDFEAAAGVYLEMKRFLLAAEMYSLGKNIKASAEAYAKGHDWRNAADCFESVGDLQQALLAYVNAGDFSRAGRLALRLNDYPKAIEYLQRVPPTSTEWRVSTGFLACAFFMQGRIDMARELFEKVTNDIAPSQETLPILYHYARLLEEEDHQQSISFYRRIQAVNVTYEDVGERVEHLQSLPPPTRQPSSYYDSQSGGTNPGFANPPSHGTSSGYGPPVPGNPYVANRSATSPSPEPGALWPPPTPPHGTNMRPRYPTRDSTVYVRVDTETDIFEGNRPPTQAPDTCFGEEGRYQIREELGRGGMAIVYRALDRHLEREVALKTFPLARPGRRGQEEMFLHEARLIARLSHPNIVTIYDTGHLDYLYYIAMEYVQGENLKALVKRKGPLGLEEVRGIFHQLGEALQYAHRQNVLHRDIKPGNVIIREGGAIKVVDFGLAKILSEAAQDSVVSEDSQRTLVGTPQYMAPEQIMGNAVDVRSDIYSLGLTMFYVLTGRTPFDVKKVVDPLEISRMQVHSSFPRPSTLRATLPRGLDDIFVRCTQKNPDDRYASAQDFLQEFDSF